MINLAIHCIWKAYVLLCHLSFCLKEEKKTANVYERRKMSEKSQKFVKMKMFWAEKGGQLRALKM